MTVALGGDSTKSKSVWPALRTMARILPQASAGFTVVAVALLLLAGLLPAAYTLLTGALVGTLPAAIRGGTGSPAAHRVDVLLVVIGATFVAQQLIGPLLALCVDALGRRLNGHLRARVMSAAAAPVGIGHLEDPEALDKVMLAQGVGSANVTPRDVVTATFAIAANYLGGIASAVILMGFRWWVPLVVIAAYLLAIQRTRRMFHRNVQAITGQAETLRRSAYFRDVALTPSAVKETRIFGLADWVVDRFRSSWRGAMVEMWRERKGGWRVLLLNAVVFFGAECGVTLYIAHAALNGQISLGRFIVFMGALGGLAAFANLSNHDLNLTWGAPAINAVVELEAMVAARSRAVAGSTPAGVMPAHDIRFDNVSFAYPGRAAVFDGLDLTITAGKSLAIVGDNGAGKTTLMKLLGRLYEPTGGRILVDGVPLAEIEPRSWQRRVSAIFQDFTRYQLTARDNVAFGNPDIEPTDQLVESAAARAGALNLVTELTHGWSTVLSRQFKDGTDLSGGQWQRLALARALYAIDAGAGVLILDEPTASLDVRAEAELYDRFLELTAGLTTLVISHRFSTVRRADRIVVVDGGRVVEDGTHDELIARGGRYAHMFGLQAARFNDAQDESEPAGA
ncbi:MAG: ATP-binding cassette, subfamily bacterial [Actinomycetota bacterium]